MDVRTALPMACFGSSASAAAIVTTSRPPNANTTAMNPAMTPPQPPGRKSRRLARPGESTPGSRPTIAAPPSARKTTIAATLRPANQNSNSPKLRTSVRFTAVSTDMKTSTHSHCGTAGTQPEAIFAAPVASTASTTPTVDQ